MAEHIWTVLCERHLVDPVNKVITLLDVVESIFQEGLGQQLDDALRSGKKGVFVNYPLQLVSWWFRSNPKDEKLDLRFTLLNPAGTKVVERIATAEWLGEAAYLRVFFALDRLPVSMLGLHWFNVECQKPAKSGKLRWVSVTSIPFAVEKPARTLPIDAPTVPGPPS